MIDQYTVGRYLFEAARRHESDDINDGYSSETIAINLATCEAQFLRGLGVPNFCNIEGERQPLSHVKTTRRLTLYIRRLQCPFASKMLMTNRKLDRRFGRVSLVISRKG